MCRSDQRCCRRPPSDLLVEVFQAGLVRHAPAGPVVDSRGALGSQHLRTLIVNELMMHLDEYPIDIVAGVANSGSTWGLLLASRVQLPFVNVLVDGPREKGLRRQLEPDGFIAGKRVLLVDNWVATGSSMELANRLVLGTGAASVSGLIVSAPVVRLSLPFTVHIAFPLPYLLHPHT